MDLYVFILFCKILWFFNFFYICHLCGGFPIWRTKNRQTRSSETAADINLHKAANQTTEAATDIVFKLSEMSLKYTAC